MSTLGDIYKKHERVLVKAAHLFDTIRLPMPLCTGKKQSQCIGMVNDARKHAWKRKCHMEESLQNGRPTQQLYKCRYEIVSHACANQSTKRKNTRLCSLNHHLKDKVHDVSKCLAMCIWQDLVLAPVAAGERSPRQPKNAFTSSTLTSTMVLYLPALKGPLKQERFYSATINASLIILSK